MERIIINIELVRPMGCTDDQLSKIRRYDTWIIIFWRGRI